MQDWAATRHTDLDVDRGYDTVYRSRGDDRIIYTRSGEEAFQEAAGTRCDAAADTLVLTGR